MNKHGASNGCTVFMYHHYNIYLPFFAFSSGLPYPDQRSQWISRLVQFRLVG
jgi:hypothetical protein